MIGISAGILFAIGFIALSRWQKWEDWTYAGSLFFLPAIYAGFGLLTGDSLIPLLELAYGVPIFLAAIYYFSSKSPLAAYIVAAAWLAHGAYDLSHNLFFINEGVWAWYPAFCAVIDFIVAAYLVIAWRLFTTAKTTA